MSKLTKEEISDKLRWWYLSWPSKSVSDYPSNCENMQDRMSDAHEALASLLKKLIGCGEPN